MVVWRDHWTSTPTTAALLLKSRHARRSKADKGTVQVVWRGSLRASPATTAAPAPSAGPHLHNQVAANSTKLGCRCEWHISGGLAPPESWRICFTSLHAPHLSPSEPPHPSSPVIFRAFTHSAFLLISLFLCMIFH